jgi:DNA repair photolyase
MDKIKPFNGKAIYQPAGRAAEYAKWACNFYIGCSNECEYCYCKRFKWGNVPTLKKCFKNETHAWEVFEKELKANLPELQKHGLFFSFTTDPMLPETKLLTMIAIHFCMLNSINMKILTKRTDWLDWALEFQYNITFGNEPEKTYYLKHFKKHIAFGWSLTGHDELEPKTDAPLQ